MATRGADLAGTWYPGRESDCRRLIEEFSRSSVPCPSGVTVGGIVPHAGWVFSGKIACNVIRCLSEQSSPDTLVLFGRHLHPSSKSYHHERRILGHAPGRHRDRSEVGEETSG